MNKVASTTVAGLALALAAAIPSHGLVVLLRGPGHEADAGLLTGIAAFRVCLLLLGGYVVFLGRFAAAYPAPRAGEPAQTPASRPEALLFAAILAVATVVRLHGLGSDLWFDEMATYVRDAGLPIGELVSTYESQNQHFLYSILAKLTMAAFGDSPWSLRLPAVIFGVAGIWALYRLGMYVANRREALLAAGLVALSYHHVWFSQNARGYTGLMFFTLLSSWLLLRGSRGTPAGDLGRLRRRRSIGDVHAPDDAVHRRRPSGDLPLSGTAGR